MNFAEKLFSIFAVVFAIGMLTAFIVIPETRQLQILLPLSLSGMVVNIGLMFIVLRDILYRQFSQSSAKIVWIILILLFWPAVLYYLPKHGFKRRQIPSS